MKQLTCTGCGATLQWDGASNVVECQFCGARFAMRGAEAGGGRSVDWRAEALKGGCVADRPCLESCVLELNDTGAVYYKSWLPKGWRYSVYPNMLLYGQSIGSPFVPGIRMVSPDGRSSITHFTTNSYQDPGNRQLGLLQPRMGLFGMMNVATMDGMQPGDGHMGIDGLIHFPRSVMDARDFIRLRHFVPAANYCDELAMDTQVQGLQAVGQATDDDFARQRMEQLLSQAPEQVRQNFWYEWCRRTYRGTLNGEPVIVVAETEVSTNGWNVQQAAYAQQAPQPQEQHGFFGRMAAAMGNAAQQAAAGMMQANMPKPWNTDYDLVMVAPEAEAEAVFAEFEQVRRSIELGRDFQQTQETLRRIMMQAMQQAQGAWNNATAQMAADQAASWDRRSATIAETNAYTTNVMREMNANTAATHDRVAGMHSEMIREVNSYSGYGGRVVEADIGYDHVYQSTPGSRWGTDAYIGVEGDWLEPGVDFVELPKRH